LRKELGVWYTPNEVVTYMVARVDKALREELGVADGLASDQVYILDPCCGTGAFLAAVLKKIDSSLDAKGYGALKGQMVKKAALNRVFGFEIMPAPFVVAHLQVGLTLQELGAGLDTSAERPGVYLTNSLSGWEPHSTKPLPFPELEEERDAADKVKQSAPILVVIGNPPYNGYAGMAVEEERTLSNAYRTTKRVRRPEGQGLNDLYIRFFRMAERRIADKTGQGIVSFISNYSWLDGLSFTGMRERYMEAFDVIRIDCLNGDKYKTGKTTPDGKSDPSIFSTEHNREGIQVGTAIATMVRKLNHAPSSSIDFRHLWGTTKRQALLKSADSTPNELYKTVTPAFELGLPFIEVAVSSDYFNWPKLPELLPVSFPGVKTSRDEFLISIDREALETRLAKYFDSKVPNHEIQTQYPSVMAASGRFDPVITRNRLVSRGVLAQNITRYLYRPFDLRWVYWEPETKLLDEKRAEYWEGRDPGQREMVIPRAQRKEWSPPMVTSSLLDLNAMDGGASSIPFKSRFGKAHDPALNIPGSLNKRGDGSIKDTGKIVFDHCLAVLHSPTYFSENGGAMRIEPPHVPLPSSDDAFRNSASLGASLSALLDPQAIATGVSDGVLRTGLKLLALPTKRGEKSIDADDLALTAGWGSTQSAGSGSTIVMPGRGLVISRGYSEEELKALTAEATNLGQTLDQTLSLLGQQAYDVHLSADVWWSCVPSNVWSYTLGGYQVIKKWLSYRERAVLGRALKPDEVAYLSEMVRRIAAILLMGPSLDANYETIKDDAAGWMAAGR
jgi:predicted helicase